ncbi:MAG: peptidylprolyl isomerase [Candidatus Solibacter sp.]|nr:peptidylprolyl isomerase [Candidatus Solibacter sp.]
MRKTWWLAVSAAVSLALGGCSSPDESKKVETPKAAPVAEKTPDVFQAVFDTSRGQVVIEVHRDWAPVGVDHFHSLIKTGFYDGSRFFRVTRSYVQFGINGNSTTNGLWSTARLPDDRVKQSNVKGTLSFAHLGANTRTTQLFFNMKNNKELDKQGFAPLGKVISGMDVVERFYSAYGEMAPRGQGPDPSKIEVQGNTYLDAKFPRLDYIKKATIQ